VVGVKLLQGLEVLEGRRTMKASQIVESIGASCKKETIDDFRVGDTVDVHVRIVEGEKERIQIFTGTVIGKKYGNRGSASFTVRRVVEGEGVERVFPIHSPRVEKVVVKKCGKVRRAKLNFLRGRTGKATKLKERRGTRGTKKKIVTKPVVEEAASEAPASDAPASEEASSEASASEQTSEE
jgi:large subunit ribosomal protein L19